MEKPDQPESPQQKGRIDIESKLKLLRAAGAKIVNGSESDFSGMTIIGTQGPPKKNSKRGTK